MQLQPQRQPGCVIPKPGETLPNFLRAHWAVNLSPFGTTEWVVYCYKTSIAAALCHPCTPCTKSFIDSQSMPNIIANLTLQRTARFDRASIRASCFRVYREARRAPRDEYELGIEPVDSTMMVPQSRLSNWRSLISVIDSPSRCTSRGQCRTSHSGHLFA